MDIKELYNIQAKRHSWETARFKAVQRILNTYLPVRFRKRLKSIFYDTQCGAKIFRNSALLKQVFGKPFKVKWTFDVEMLARFPIVMGVSPSEVSSGWVERPLDEWVDVKGSKLKGKDFIKGGIEFGILYFYLCTPARKIYEKYLLDIDPK